MPSPTDFNLSPYYDDFTESKKFHRILFRPAFAVQARELTQSQTQLQNQIERVSDHIFDKGAMVIPGEIGYDLDYYAVKLTSLGFGNTLAQFTNGTILTGGTSGVTAEVVNTVVTDGTDPDTLYVKYRDSGTSKTATSFSDGETLTGTNSDSISLSCVVDTTATGCAAEVQEGVYYINGFHVQVTNQTIILDKYTNTPSYRVGMIVTESFVTPNDDTSLNDNAAGTSNVNAPGAHRFKINLTLAKKSLTALDDANFVELLRLKAGIIQNQVRTTEYAVLEDTLARRTFDESGDYAVRDFDLDLREHLISGNNRGIYSSGNGGSEAKIAAGLSPGKAYVRGYEIETIGTTFVDVDKARDFNTQNAFATRFDVGNFVNVTNVYGAPDVGAVSGETNAFGKVDLFDTATSSRGTGNTRTDTGINTIGRAKSKGFEFKSGTATSNIYSSSSLTSAVYKHYLFDINMFTHLNITTAQSFTTGEEITGSTSGAKATVESISTTESGTISGVTQADPAVVTVTGHNFQEGQQVTISSVAGMTELNGNVYTVRNPGTNDFQLYNTDGTTSIDSSGFSAYSSGGTAAHGVVIVSSVNGEFVTDETITGAVSSNTAVIQSDAVGFKGVRPFDFPAVKQIYNAASAAYTADTVLDSTNGDNFVLSGTLDIGSGSASVTGINTKFTTELEIGDSVSFTNDSGNTETKIIEAIISDTSLTFTTVTAAASTKTIATRRRSKLQDSNKNISIFKLPYRNIKTLKTASNSNITDTSFAIRRQFVITLTGGSGQITAGTNEAFPSSASDSDFVISVDDVALATGTATGDTLTTIGNNHEGNPIFSQPSGTGTTVFDFGSNYADAKIKIVATVNRATAGSKTKTLREDRTQDVTTLANAIKQGGINLGKTDIYQIKSIYMATAFGVYSASGAIDITSRYDLDNGQRDNYYDVGRIKLKTGELEPTGTLRITFD